MNALLYSRRAAAVAALALLSATACGGDDDDVTDPDGSVAIALSSSSLTLQQGATGTVTVNVTRNGFTQPLTLSVTNLPTGISAANVIIGEGQTQGVLTFTATAAAEVGSKAATVSVGGSGLDAATATLNVTVGSGAVYDLTTSNPTLTIAAGASGTATINAARLNGFTGPVDLTVNAPAGVTAILSPTTLTSGVLSSVLTVNVDATVVPGTYTLTVQGQSTGQTPDTVVITLTVS